MNIQLVAAQPNQIATLQNLWQLYSHDFTEFLPEDVDELGLYPYDFDFEDYFQKPGYWAYLARVGGNIAGFALFSDWVTLGHGKGRHMEEFFVLRRYRGKGIGRSIAFQAFETYLGYWEVSEVATNIPAIAFWRKVISDYTDGNYQETRRSGRDTDIVLQMFDSRAG